MTYDLNEIEDDVLVYFYPLSVFMINFGQRFKAESECRSQQKCPDKGDNCWNKQRPKKFFHSHVICRGITENANKEKRKP